MAGGSQFPTPAVWSSLIECSDQSGLNSLEFAFLAEISELSDFDLFNGIRAIATFETKPIPRRNPDPDAGTANSAIHALAPNATLRASLGRVQICLKTVRDLKAGEWRYISTVHGLPVPLYVLAVL